MKLDGAFRPFGQLEIVTRIIRMARGLTWKKKRKKGFLKYLEGLKRYYDKDLCEKRLKPIEKFLCQWNGLSSKLKKQFSFKCKLNKSIKNYFNAIPYTLHYYF